MVSHRHTEAAHYINDFIEIKKKQSQRKYGSLTILRHWNAEHCDMIDF